MRPSKRKNNQIRQVTIETASMLNAAGSCLIKCGNTHVMCSATVENTVPSFLRGQGQGWLTAEYAMLPSSTNSRTKRESVQGKQTGRSQEIQRLIARSLRGCIDLKLLGERQIIIDCDVINADGGTRTTAITGGYIALQLAIRSLMNRRVIKTNPLITQVAAISCGIYKGQAVVDLDYLEDGDADVDANFIFAGTGHIIEVQACAEKVPFTDQQFLEMLALAKQAAAELFKIQNHTLLGV